MSLSTVPYALAVDDDPFILMDVTGILEDAGFRTYEADHGDAAIAMLPEYAHTITLLFSDVDMPGDTDGFALAHHVAENYPWIEIVIGSGHLRPKAGDLPEKATFVSVQCADDSWPSPRDPSRWQAAGAPEKSGLDWRLR
jgi:CheY-like chemotaxis protein